MLIFILIIKKKNLKNEINFWHIMLVDETNTILTIFDLI